MSLARIPESDDDLLAECDVETYGSSGPGGQNVNRRETAVRLRHRPTGVVVTCQRERSQYRNKRIALVNLRAKLRELFRPRRRRVPTATPRGAKERILADKRHQARKKGRRREPSEDE